MTLFTISVAVQRKFRALSERKRRVAETTAAAGCRADQYPSDAADFLSNGKSDVIIVPYCGVIRITSQNHAATDGFKASKAASISLLVRRAPACKYSIALSDASCAARLEPLTQSSTTRQ